MYADAFLQLSAAQSITTGSILSTNTVDLSVARDIGEGQTLFLRSQVTTAFATMTSVEIQIIIADDAALTTNVEVVGSSGAIPVASLTLGARFAATIEPKIGSKGRRYMGARYVVVGNGTGNITTDIGVEIQDAKSYPSGFAVI